MENLFNVNNLNTAHFINGQVESSLAISSKLSESTESKTENIFKLAMKFSCGKLLIESTENRKWNWKQLCTVILTTLHVFFSTISSESSILKIDKFVKAKKTGSAIDAKELGEAVADEVLTSGGREILLEIRAINPV